MENPILTELGVDEHTLTSSEKDFLDKNGYLNLGRLLDDDQLARIRGRLLALMHNEGEAAGKELMDSPFIKHPKEEGADRLADLVNKGEVFDIFYTHPRVLAAMRHVLGEDFKLSSLNYRSAKPGKGLQKLHVDWHETVLAHDYKVCNSIWLLDDFSEENGATRIVPGTHLGGVLPQDALKDQWEPHPDQIIIEAPAGSVFIFNSHTWHGGTTNRTSGERRSIHSYFCGKGQPQQVDQSRYILEETLARIPKAAHEVLGLS